MNQLIPQGKTIVAYLLAKGWEVGMIEYTEDQLPFTFFMSPPKDMKIEGDDLKLRVPIYQDTIDYRQYVDIIISSIAAFYDMDKNLLVRFFSKPLDIIIERSMEVEQLKNAS